MADSRDFLIGVLVGSAIGAAAALMYAPMAGHETRQMLRDKAGEAKERIPELAQQAKDRAGDLAQQAKGRATDAVQQAQTRVSDLTDQAKTRIGEMQTQVSGQVQGVVDKGRGMIDQQKEAINSAVSAGKQAYMDKQSELSSGVAQDTASTAPA